ncbi:MAG: hypothetical protein ABI693_13260 [Bryobacteraceae bacterium]
MNRITNIMIASLYSALGIPLGLASVSTLTQRADLVVVARSLQIRGVSDGSEVDLQVVRVLKGGQPTTVTISVSLPGVPAPPSLVAGACGIWFLERSRGQGSNWTGIAQSAEPMVYSYYWYLASCAPPQTQSYQAGASPVDKILSEMTESAERSDGKGAQALLLYRALNGSGSPIADQAIRRFTDSRSPELRSVAFALGILKGNIKSLERAEQEIINSPKGEHFGPLLMAVANFTNPDGVATLGRMATNPNVPPAATYAAAEALKVIHSPAALAFLYVLLDNPDGQVRANAVMGFTLFRLGMPPALRGQAFDRASMEAANPGKQIAPEDREGLHLGQFKSRDEESQLINFYPSWWPKNERRFSPIR